MSRTLVRLDCRRANAHASFRAWRLRSRPLLAVMYQAGTGCGALRLNLAIFEVLVSVAGPVSPVLPVAPVGPEGPAGSGASAPTVNRRVAAAELPAGSVARTLKV
jgi:hypothetical protein